jgi:hypothetical protein
MMHMCFAFGIECLGLGAWGLGFRIPAYRPPESGGQDAG